MSKSIITIQDANGNEIICGEFKGRYQDEQEKFFARLVELGVTEVAAHKVCHAAICDFGRLTSGANAAIKVGKWNKDSKATLGESLKTKGAELTPALKVIHALAWMEDAGKHGVSYGFTSWKFADDLVSYMDNLS